MPFSSAVAVRRRKGSTCGSPRGDKTSSPEHIPGQQSGKVLGGKWRHFPQGVEPGLKHLSTVSEFSPREAPSADERGLLYMAIEYKLANLPAFLFESAVNQIKRRIYFLLRESMVRRLEN